MVHPSLLETPSNTAHLETFQEDACCQKHLMKAKRASLDSWTCPKCGCEWKPRMVGNIRHWEVHEVIAIWR